MVLDIMGVAGAEPIVPETSRAIGFIDLAAPAADPLRHDTDLFSLEEVTVS